MAFDSPHAVLFDAGELEDIRSMLARLGVPYSDGIPKGWNPDRAIPLLITTAARARSLGAGKPSSYLHLVVVEPGESGGEGLRDLPCDFVVQRPVEEAVLRLLTQRAGYAGPERRRMLRVAIGGSIGLFVDGREFEAQLAQLSIGGCGAVTTEPPEPGGRVALEFPRELTAPRTLRVRGRVLSAREAKGSNASQYDVSIAFEDVDLRDRVTLRAIMAGQPIDFRPKPSLRPDPGPPATAARAPRRRRAVVPADGDRRSVPRRIYNRQILGGSEGFARVLIGRDISPAGMRIEREAMFRVGEELKIAVYGGPGVCPVMLKAVVERDDGEEGWYLRFASLSPAVQRDIEKLMRSLAPLDLPEKAGSVVTEVLESS